jgi:outer membrane protein assembly factor BamB
MIRLLFVINFYPMHLLYLTSAALAAFSLALLNSGCSSPSSSHSYSAAEALAKFTAADVPATGPEELPVAAPRWTNSPLDTNLPGGGLARHPMLFIGEGYNKMFVVNEGKVVWTYSTGNGNEYDDIWLLSNGNILFSRLNYAAEVTPEKKIVWHMDPPRGMEIHTVQPIGLDKVLMIENGTPPKLVIVNKKTGAVEVDHDIQDAGAGVHSQFRRVRMTAAGTYLVPFLEVNKVVEYDKDFKEIWSYKINSPWAAIRLHNGNTLITDEDDRLTREVNPKGETVWEFKLRTDLPAGITVANTQTCARLDNGNTVICSRGNNGKGCQLIEVTPDKKVVWALNDWKDLGPATAVQLLDDPGYPERPGDLQR